MGWVLPKPAFPSLSARQVGARQLCSDSQKPGFCCQLHPGAAAAASTCLERRLEWPTNQEKKILCGFALDLERAKMFISLLSSAGHHT